MPACARPIAASIARNRTLKALILESTFTSIPDVAADWYPWLPVRLIVRFKYSTKDFLSEVNCPVLIVHSRNDELISFRFGKELFETAREPKQFLEISGSHGDGFFTSGEIYQNTLKDFIAKYGGTDSQRDPGPSEPPVDK